MAERKKGKTGGGSHKAAGEEHAKKHAAHIEKVHTAVHSMRHHKAKGVKVAVRAKHV